MGKPGRATRTASSGTTLKSWGCRDMRFSLRLTCRLVASTGYALSDRPQVYSSFEGRKGDLSNSIGGLAAPGIWRWIWAQNADRGWRFATPPRRASH